MEKKSLRLRGKLINEDAYGNICLTDIWHVAKRPTSQTPAHWMSHGSTIKFIAVAYDKIIALDYDKEKIPFNRVCYAKRGRYGVSFAHPLIAAKYAGYLDPRLEVQIVEVWLRYRAGDPTLADEILERASAEANEWAARRAMSRKVRNSFTDTLKDHNVSKHGYPLCTETIYIRLLGAKAWQLRRRFGLPAKGNVRDKLGILDLTGVMTAEALATDRIQDENCRGDAECQAATDQSASFIREAFDRDRASRSRKRIV
jgi:hypothetical protein